MEIRNCRRAAACVVALLFIASSLPAQTTVTTGAGDSPSRTTTLSSDAATYFDATSGVSSIDLVRRAIGANRELAGARLSIAGARARVAQARLLPNPSLDIEQTTGSWTNAAGESETAIGLAIPIELGGKRSSRIAVAQAELNAAEAEFRDRQRRLVSEVLAAYVDALAALREIDVTARLHELDRETGTFVQTRVAEGDASPLELNLLRVEIERLRARRTLLRGQVDVALIRLRHLTGTPLSAPLKFRQAFDAATPDPMPESADEAISRALQNRPDLQLARLNEELAVANLRFVGAQAFPDLTGFTQYSSGRAVFDDTPVGPLIDQDKLLTFGVSISLPFFNRNQGLRAEARAIVEQAQRQREFSEAVVRAEVESALRRYEAAREALSTYQSGVIDASVRNIGVIEAAYRLGEFRITDLIAERRRLVDSEREFTELLAERQRALTDLQIAMGVFGPEEK